MFQVEQIGGGHHLIGFKAFGDRIQLVLQLAHRDRRLQGELGIGGKFAGLDALLELLEISFARILFEFLKAAEAEDEALTGGLGDSGERNGQLLLSLDLNPGAQTLAILQLPSVLGKTAFTNSPWVCLLMRGSIEPTCPVAITSSLPGALSNTGWPRARRVENTAGTST